MLIKPFTDITTDRPDPRDIDHSGIVVNNDDPDMQGKVQILIDIWEDYEDKDLPWCLPTPSSFLGNSTGSADFSVPEVGSEVTVYFPKKDLAVPYFKGAEFNTKNKATIFEEDYPNSYGKKDSTGNFTLVNKKQHTIKMQHSSTLNLYVKEDGEFVITNPNGYTITLTEDGVLTINCKEFNITAEENINMTAKAINMTAENGITETVPQTQVSGRVIASDVKTSGVASVNGHIHGNGNDGNPTTAPLG